MELTPPVDAATRRSSLAHRNLQLQLLLLWEGELKRARLIDLFGLSPVRASEWIAAFRDLHPEWLRWDSKARAYHATPAAYHTYNADRSTQAQYSIAQYVALAGLPESSTGSHTPAPAYAAAREFVIPNPRLFALLRQAIVQHGSARLTYRSLREPEPHQHEIEPHSLVRAGPHWHVRAYSRQHAEFRDFALGRVTDAKLLDVPARHGVKDDAGWTTMIKVRFAPHPALSIQQQDVVRFEYFKNTSGRVETTRAALVPYLVQNLRVAIDYTRQTPPDYLLVLQNVDEVKPWLFPT